MITTDAPTGSRWRTRDILVTAVIGVAFGVVFWVWGLAWYGPFAPLETMFVARDLLYAVWLVPAVLAPLIVRRPGAAVFAEMVAAGVSALLGSAWGVDTLLSGFVQGAAAELVFAFTLYRLWSFPVLALAGLASAAAAYVHDVVVWYAGYAGDVLLVIAIAMAGSGLILLPAASIALVRALRRAGVLEGFPD
jgi:energy-coupling factor transport system substrate-specific component